MSAGNPKPFNYGFGPTPVRREGPAETFEVASIEDQGNVVRATLRLVDRRPPAPEDLMTEPDAPCRDVGRGRAGRTVRRQG